MKTRKIFMLLLCLLFVIPLILNAQLNRKAESYAGKAVKEKMWKEKQIQYVANEIVVQISASATQSEINSLLKSVGGKEINPFDELGIGLIELPADNDEVLAINEVKKFPFVIAAAPNILGKICYEANDPFYKGTSPATYAYQWSLKNTGQIPPEGTIDADIDAPEAWDITTGNANVIIAILDTGIPMLNGALSHPDLNNTNRIILGPDYVGPNGDLEGVRDRSGHGTHVTGIATAQTNNNTGIAGVAGNSKIMVIQVANAYGFCSGNDFYEGVKYAVDYQLANPSKKVVINCSLAWLLAEVPL